MDNITTQDCYILSWNRSGDGSYEQELSFMLKDKFLEKHNMVCLTKEDFEKVIMDAWTAALNREFYEGFPNKYDYINSIIK